MSMLGKMSAGASATEHAFQHYELSRDVRCN